MSSTWCDPVAGLKPSDPCWCRSGRAHGECHGSRRPPSVPGAPLPDDDDGAIYIAPGTALARSATVHPAPGSPIYAPSDEPQQRPQPVSVLAEQIVRRTLRTPSISLSDLGRQRYILLDELGLSDPATLATRLATFSEADRDSLRYGTFDIAKSILDRLLEERLMKEPPLSVWSGGADAVRLVGATLFWADHYLASDELGAALEKDWDHKDIERAVRQLIDHRPLVEAGIVVPVLDALLTLLTADVVHQQTDQDLANAALVRWVMDQLVVEGPTARECVLLTAVDDVDDLVMYFMYGHIVPSSIDDASGTFLTRMFGDHDPDFDYRPWIEQCLRQTAVRLMQELNRDLTIADALGAEYVTLSPFRARLLEERGSEPSSIGSLVWSEVPVLTGATPEAIRRIADAEEPVEALRATVRRASAAMRSASPPDKRARAAELSGELQDASMRLSRQMARDRIWELALPTIAAAGTVALGAASGGLLAAAVPIVAGVLGLGQHAARQRSRREEPGYALLLGDGLVASRAHDRALDVLKPIDQFAQLVGPSSSL